MEEPDGVAQELEEILPGRVTRDVAGYLKDWWPLLWITEEPAGKALAAVRPVNVDELSRLARFAAEKRVPLFIRGGGSSVTGASIPAEGLVVDMAGMDQVLDLDESSRTVTAQAGVRIKVLEEKLNAKGYTLSQFPQSVEMATVGGYISTLGTGQYSTLYGGIEDSVIRLEVVLPTAEVVWTRKRGAPRSSVGPDLSRIFLGAEGALGIVSAAELRIRKLPKHVWKSAYVFRDFASAANASKALMELDVKPAVCRAYNEVESLFQFGEQVCTMLVVYHFTSERVLADVREEASEILEEHSTVADPELVDRWLAKRFSFRSQIEEVKKMGYIPETVEVAAKWGRVLDLYYDTVATLGEMRGVGGVGAHISHLYDQGACIYFTVLLRPEAEAYQQMWDGMAKLTRTHDATISHHHGVGLLKRVYAREEIPGSVMRKIKQALDPDDILNPGRLP